MNLKPIFGWMFVSLGLSSSIAKALGHPEISAIIDQVLGNIQPILVGAGAAVLHVSPPSSLKAVVDE